MNSSVMAWRGGDIHLQNIYHHLSLHYADVRLVVHKFDHYLEMMIFGEGGESKALECGRVSYLQDLFPGAITDFDSVQCDYPAVMETDGLGRSRIVCFPLSPKPHEVKDVWWVKKFWMTSV